MSRSSRSEHRIVATSPSALTYLRTTDAIDTIFLPFDAVNGAPPDWDYGEFHRSIGFACQRLGIAVPKWRDGRIDVTRTRHGYLAHYDEYHPYREPLRHLTQDTTGLQKLILTTLAMSVYRARSARHRSLLTHLCSFVPSLGSEQ